MGCFVYCGGGIFPEQNEEKQSAISIKPQEINIPKLNNTELATKNITSNDHELDGR